MFVLSVAVLAVATAAVTVAARRLLRRRRMRLLSEEPLVLLGPEGEVELWNDAAEAAFGYSRHEMLGGAMEALLPVALTGAGPRATFETSAHRKDQTELPVEVTTLLVNTGRKRRTLALLRDASGRQQREEELRRAKEKAEQVAAELEAVNSVLEKTTVWANEMAAQTAMANAAKSEFLASMSHEIRTPMNGVLGMLTLLERTELSREQLDYVETIRYSGQILLDIINQILDFSRIESGRLELELVEFDPRREIEQAVVLFAERAEAKGLELLTTISEAVPARLRADPGRFRQVLINLLGNAVKFTEQGEVSVAVSSRSLPGSRAELRVEVVDTGIGMPPEVVRKLFQAFYQGEDSTRRRYGGTGLGLAISKKLVEAMHGSIAASSSPGKGSSFQFTVVAEVLPAPGRQFPPRPDVSVLVVHRHVPTRKMIRSCAAAWGIEVAEADAAPPPGSERYSFVIADATDPDLEQLRHCWTDKPGGPALLLIVPRGEGRPAEALGARALIAKPIRPSRLREALLQFTGAQPEAGASLTLLSRAVAAPGVGPKILIAEDNPVNQKVARKLVEKLGYSADVAENGEAALKAAAAGGYAVVLMDCQMPVMDGFRATQAIRRLPEPCGLVPIVAMTANAVKGDREKCLAAGMTDYLAKPVSLEELRAALERWCGKTHPTQPPEEEPDWEALTDTLTPL